MDELRLTVRAAGAAYVVTHEAPASWEVHGRGLLEVEIEAPPAATVWLRVDGEEQALSGALVRRWSSDRLLRTRAGRVGLEVGCGPLRRQLWLDVQPTKLTLGAVRSLLDQLDVAAHALSGRFSEGAAAQDPAALLESLDALIGPLSEAASALRVHPLHRRRQQQRAVPASVGASRAADVRWLSRHPAAALRAGGGVRQVAVQSEVEVDLDVVENRGVVGLFGRIDDALAQADALLVLAAQRGTERARVLGEAPRERAWHDPEAVPQTAIEARRTRLRGLRDQVEWARRRTGLPASLPPAPRLPLTHAVRSEPAYWRLHEVQRVLGGLAMRAPLQLAAPRDLDLLYEQWCVLKVVEAVAGWAGVAWAEQVAVRVVGELVHLEPGRLLDLAVGDVQVRVDYEPSYVAGGQDALVKLQPGRPWRPDLAIELARAGHPYRLHLFDAKHRRDPERAFDGGMPLAALQEIWFNYGDGIGDRDTGHPVVGSVWMLWPGDGPQRTLRAPTMLGPDWPSERVRGGAISLRPDQPRTTELLRETVAALLEQEGLRPSRRAGADGAH